MPIEPEKSLNAIMTYWQELADRNEPYTHYAGKKLTLDDWEAVRFFVGIMLDQRQPADRAWDAAHEFARKAKGRRWSPRTVWQRIAEMNIHEIRDFCQFEDDGKWQGSYAGINRRKFEGYGRKRGWLRENAQRIIDEYEYVDNIWNNDLPEDNEGKLLEIHKRLSAFGGIGKNLANMAVFSLIREHGYAGGRKSRGLLKIKFDTHVQRVVDRAIISGNPQLGPAKRYVEKVLNGGGILESPADFDYATFRIGKDFCQYDDCGHCPIQGSCNAYLQNDVDEIDDAGLPVTFLNQDPRCFARYKVLDCEITCMIQGRSYAYFADEDEVRRHDAGFSVKLKEGFECALRLTAGGFMFSMARCPGYQGSLENINVYPYIAEDDIVFVHQGDDIIILLRVDIDKIDME